LRKEVISMTVRYTKLPPVKEGVTTVRCFYEHDGKKAEFYVHVNSHKHTIRFAPSKKGSSPAVLTVAFAEAMASL
jgi:hypothetical protein